MVCQYSYYDPSESYMPRLYCKAKGGYCIYSKKCLKEEKFIPLDNQKECYIMIEEMRKDIPNGSYFVQTYRPNKKGNLYLYVLINDSIVRILTELTELNQNYVYLKETLDGYEVSLVPFKSSATQQKRTSKSTKKQ